MKLVTKYIIIILTMGAEIFPQISNYKYYADLFFLNNNFGVIIKNDGTILITKDSGGTWLINKLSTTDNLQGVVFTSESNGWIISEQNLFSTKDGGISWKQIPLPSHQILSSIYFISDSTGFIGGQDSVANNMILITNDFGKNWKLAQIDSSFNSTILQFDFLNDSLGVATDNMTLYKTEDGGKYWSKMPIWIYSTSGGFISSKILSEDTIITSCWYADVVAESYLIISNNGGINWNNYGNGQNFRWGISDQYFISKEKGWITTNYSLYTTENGGNNWDTLNVNVSKFNFINNHNAWGINGSTILFTNDGWNTYSIIDSLITNIENTNSRKTNYQLSQNYPNPFNPTTVINYSIPKQSNVRLVIYNVLGRKLATLINEEKPAGNYSILFDGHNFSTGIYFYQLIADNFIQTKKMILMK